MHIHIVPNISLLSDSFDVLGIVSVDWSLMSIAD